MCNSLSRDTQTPQGMVFLGEGFNDSWSVCCCRYPGGRAGCNCMELHVAYRCHGCNCMELHLAYYFLNFKGHPYMLPYYSAVHACTSHLHEMDLVFLDPSQPTSPSQPTHFQGTRVTPGVETRRAGRGLAQTIMEMCDLTDSKHTSSRQTTCLTRGLFLLIQAIRAEDREVSSLLHKCGDNRKSGDIGQRPGLIPGLAERVSLPIARCLPCDPVMYFGPSESLINDGVDP